MRWILRKLAVPDVVTSESGVTAIEYGLIAALIAVVIITAVATLGTNLSGTFTTISNTI
jgi:pilus assembly protein Flp/PilA